MRRYLVFLGHGAANCLADRFGARRTPGPVHLSHHDEPFLFAGIHCKSRAAPFAYPRMAFLHCVFDIGGMMVAPRDDDVVLEPACDEKIALVEKSKIASAQKSFSRAFLLICQVHTKRGCRLLRPVPITLRYVWP